MEARRQPSQGYCSVDHVLGVFCFPSVSYYALPCLGVGYRKPTALVLAPWVVGMLSGPPAWQASTLPLGYTLSFFLF